MISMIWAMDKNWLIGKNNQIPWHYKEDLLYYKGMTNGKTVLMGDKTYYSLKGYYKDRPLPYNKIYVASLDKLVLEDAILVPDINKFLSETKEDIIVVGGAMIYKLSLPYASRLYITHIDKSFDGDTYFPKFDLGSFEKISSRRSEINPELEFAVYERR